jgi:HD-GYP domain-containing protein (c-di-GMP phosphodiesterase class II)
MELFRLTILGTVAVANIGLALVVFLRNRKSAANRAFAAAVFAILCWLILDFMGSAPAFASSALLLNRVIPAVGMLMGSLLLYFSLAFPHRSGPLPAAWRAFFALGGVLMATTVLSDLVVAKVSLTPTGTVIGFGPLFPLFASWALVGVLAMVVVFYRKYRRAEARLKTQIRYMLLGAALFATSSLAFGLLIPMLTGWYWFSQLVALSSILLVGFTAYAMVKHRLMDVRLVVLRSAAYTVLVAAVGAIMVLPAVVIRANSASGLGAPTDATFLVLSLVAVFAFQPVRGALEHATDGFLYRRTYNPDQLLNQLGTAMSATLDIEALGSLLAGQLAQSMRLSFAAVAYLRRECPVAVGTGVAFSDADARRLLASCQGTSMVVADDIQDGGECSPLLAELQVRVLAPLVMDGIILGAIVLGPKQSGEMYSSQDLKFLEILAPEASIAMNNALLFDERNQRVSELTALNELAYALGRNTELGPVLDSAIQQVMTVTAADSGSIMLLDSEDMTLRIVASFGIPARVVASTQPSVDAGIAGWVAKTREPLILVDDTDPRFKQELRRAEIVSAISVPIVFKDSLVGVLNVNRRYSADIFTRENLSVVTSFAGQMAVVIENARLFSELENTTLGTIEALAAAVDAKDSYTAGHSKAVTDYAVAIGRKMRLSDDELQTLHIAAVLHDIGKIGVDGAILNKDGHLDEDEWVQIRRHPTMAADILSPLEFLRDSVPLILFHHERFGGGGYPSGVSGHAIPLGARIIAVADSFNAMTSNRPYRNALPHEQAIHELIASSVTQFDPDVVRAFLEVLDEEGPDIGRAEIAVRGNMTRGRTRRADLS